ncbi:MAG TPA: methionyl-tRNA formyltransferase [Candidatus Hydrogenedentes bacterium]|nr:methionyl-tRNA formyltransferase [Candidatus Hydrogenedentota bacterium]
MRTVFFGTPDLAVPSLSALARRHEVVGLVCQPDRPSGRGKVLTPPPTKIWALEHGIPVIQPQKLNDGTFEKWLREQAPEVCGLTAYGRILKQPILDVAPHGILNMHPSLLPLYRGPSPIQSAIINGETETGISIMRLTLDMDAGDILLQERVSIDSQDDGVTLSARLAEKGAEMLCDAIDAIAAGEARYTPQNHSNATYCRLIEKRDGQIDWNKPGRAIQNLVRGALPWPVAQTNFRGQVLRILKVALELDSDPASQSIPGTIVTVEKSRLRVQTGDGYISLVTLQPPGKKPMAIGDFLRGHSISAGERFENFS